MNGTAADAENNFVGLSGELQGGSRRRLLARSRMSKGNFERKLTIYTTRMREGLCANTHTNAAEVLQEVGFRRFGIGVHLSHSLPNLKLRSNSPKAPKRKDKPSATRNTANARMKMDEMPRPL
jgi:hypothetical protein